jgi:hypothetical protein
MKVKNKPKYPFKLFGYPTRIKCRNVAVFVNYFSNSGNGKPKIQIIFASLIIDFNIRKEKKRKKLVRCIQIIHLLASLHGSKTWLEAFDND